jgi:hypothetical protein
VPVGLLTFLLHLLLVYPALFPGLRQIDWADESVYLYNGRQLLEGHWPCFEANPLVAGFYALIFWPLRSHPDGFVLACGTGRLILFGLLWLAAARVARQLRDLVSPWVLYGLLLVSPVLVQIVRNPSDGLFAALSGLAFARVLNFYHQRQMHHLWLASFVIGLAALARNDGLVLGPVVAVAGACLALPLGRVGRALVATAVPSAAVVGGYVIGFGQATGDYRLGTLERAYGAFEQGQGMTDPDRFRDPATEGPYEARRLFGTPEENEFSVLRAVRRNPTAFLDRVGRTLRKLPRQMVDAYGAAGDLGFVFMALAGRGIWELVRRKSYSLSLLFLAWLVPLGVYLPLWVREGYLMLPFFAVFGLAGVGVAAIADGSGPRSERTAWSVLLVGCAGLALGTNRPVLFVANTAFLLCLWLVWEGARRCLEGPAARFAAFAVLLGLGLALRGGYPTPTFERDAGGPEDEAVRFLQRHYPPGARVAAWMPRDVAAAGMTYVPLYPEYSAGQSESELWEWIRCNDVCAFYADRGLRDGLPSLWHLLRGQLGAGLYLALATAEGGVQILGVIPPESRRPSAGADSPNHAAVGSVTSCQRRAAALLPASAAGF